MKEQTMPTTLWLNHTQTVQDVQFKFVINREKQEVRGACRKLELLQQPMFQIKKKRKTEKNQFINHEESSY